MGGYFVRSQRGWNSPDLNQALGHDVPRRGIGQGQVLRGAGRRSEVNAVFGLTLEDTFPVAKGI
jgi:hypothetical protein